MWAQILAITHAYRRRRSPMAGWPKTRLATGGRAVVLLPPTVKTAENKGGVSIGIHGITSRPGRGRTPCMRTPEQVLRRLAERATRRVWRARPLVSFVTWRVVDPPATLRHLKGHRRGNGRPMAPRLGLDHEMICSITNFRITAAFPRPPFRHQSGRWRSRKSPRRHVLLEPGARSGGWGLRLSANAMFHPTGSSPPHQPWDAVPFFLPLDARARSLGGTTVQDGKFSGRGVVLRGLG